MLRAEQRHPAPFHRVVPGAGRALYRPLYPGGQAEEEHTATEGPAMEATALSSRRARATTTPRAGCPDVMPE